MSDRSGSGRSSSRSRSRSSSDDFDAIYGGRQPRSGDSAIEGRDTPKDEEEDEYYFSTVGKKIFARGLPFGWDKAAIREKFATAGKILSVATTKSRPGTATIEYDDPKAASSALLTFDGEAVGHRKLLITIAQQFFKPPPIEVEPESAEEEEFNTNSMVCPLSFSGRGSKTVEKKALYTVKKWRSIFCKYCGLRGHTTEGCPLGLKTYHERVVKGEAIAGLLGVKTELGLIKKPKSPEPAGLQLAQFVKAKSKVEPKGVRPADPPRAVAPPRGRGAAMAKPAWMTRDAPKANAAAIKQVADEHDAHLKERKKTQAQATERMEAVRRKDFAQQLRPTKRKSAADKLQYAGAEASDADPETQRKEWEQQVLQYYKNFSAPQVFCYGMDNGIFLRYTTAYIVELPPGVTDPNGDRNKKDMSRNEKDKKSYETPMGRMVPNMLHLCRLLPSSNRILAIDVTPKRQATESGGKKKRNRKKKENQQSEAEAKEVCPVEDLSATMQDVQQQTPEAAKNAILQVAARAQPFTAHLDFDLNNHDAENLRQVTIGQAMQLLKNFVEDSVREELANGTWTAVWVKDACRYYYTNATSGLSLWDLDQAKEPQVEDTSTQDKDNSKTDNAASSRSDRSRNRRDTDRDRDRDRSRDRDRDRRRRHRSRSPERRQRSRSRSRSRDRARRRENHESQSQRRDSRQSEFRRRDPAPARRPEAGDSRDGGRGAYATGGGSKGREYPPDWTCPSCGNINFARRMQCNRCGAPRPSDDSAAAGGGYQSHNSSYQRGGSSFQRGGGGGGFQQRGGGGFQQRGGGGGGGFEQRPGDWRCNSCGNLNFARRTECNRCGAPRPSDDSAAAGGGYQSHNSSYQRGGGSFQRGGGGGGFQSRPGDWRCNSCGNLNFARRTECNRCGAPRQDKDEQSDYGDNRSGGYRGSSSGQYQQTQQGPQYGHGGHYQQQQQRHSGSGAQWGNQQSSAQNYGRYSGSNSGGRRGYY